MKKSWDNFLAEADAGEGLKFPRKMKFYIKWILPIVVLVIFVKGYYDIFSKMF